MQMEITERKRAEEVLQQSEERYHSLFSATNEGVALHELIYDKSGEPVDYRILDVNPAYESILGIKKQDAMGAKASDLYGIGEAPYLEIFSKVAVSGESFTLEIKFDPMGKHFKMSVFSPAKGKFVTLFMDITEHKKAEEALKESEEKYRSLIVNIPDVVWTSDQNGHTTFISSNIEKIYGYTQGEIYEESELLWFGRIHPDDVDRVKKAFEAVFEEGLQLDVEYRIRRKDGEWIWLHDRSIGAYEKNGIKYADGVFSDISERKKSEEEIERIFNITDYMICIANLNGYFIRINSSFEQILGYSSEELLKKPFFDFIHPDDREKTQSVVEVELSSGFKVIGFENRYRCKDGSYKWLSWTSCPVVDEGIMYAIAYDITERKKAEEKLIEYQADLHSLVSQLTMTEERERKEIAGLLHDDLIQRLVTCKMRVDELSESKALIGNGSPLDEIGESIREMIRGARSLTFDLCSPVLYDIGLEAAIRDWLDREVSDKYDITFEFTDDGQQIQFSEDLRVTLYRAVRELCTNVLKHSKAHKAKVSIHSNDNNAEIIVEDDGGGITTDDNKDDSSERGGLGLFGIRERLERFGASMNIESEAEAGTRVTIMVPLNL
jgi:PAS domain S-box-containing protein